MCYKTIVVHVDHSPHAGARIRYAAQLAARCGAHLVGSAFSGISRYAEAGSTMLLTRQHERRGNHDHDHDTALARFDAIAAAAGVVSHERRYADDEPAGGLALQGRYADLVIVSQTDLDDPAAAHLAGPVPAQVVQGSARPVLVLPHVRRHETDGICACRQRIVGHRIDPSRAGANTDMTCIKNRGDAKPGRRPSPCLAL